MPRSVHEKAGSPDRPLRDDIPDPVWLTGASRNALKRSPGTLKVDLKHEQSTAARPILAHSREGIHFLGGSHLHRG